MSTYRGVLMIFQLSSLPSEVVLLNIAKSIFRFVLLLVYREQ